MHVDRSKVHAETQSWSDPPPVNTHVIKTNMDPIGLPCDLLSGQDIMKTPLDIDVHGRASQDMELMICNLVQSFWSQWLINQSKDNFLNNQVKHLSTTV